MPNQLTDSAKMRNNTKVVIVGLSKTGTSTLKEMLTTLGYRVCGPRKELISKIRMKDYAVIEPYLDEYDAFEDWPWPLTYEYILERYGSNAKFILTTRISSEKWFESIRQHGYTSSIFKSMRDTYGYYRPFGRKNEFCKIYETHNRDVRDFFSNYSNQFTEFCLERSDGWDALCHFLDKPIPNLEVPHLNRSSKNKKRTNRFLNKLVEPFYKFVSSNCKWDA